MNSMNLAVAGVEPPLLPGFRPALPGGEAEAGGGDFRALLRGECLKGAGPGKPRARLATAVADESHLPAEPEPAADPESPADRGEPLPEDDSAAGLPVGAGAACALPGFEAPRLDTALPAGAAPERSAGPLAAEGRGSDPLFAETSSRLMCGPDGAERREVPGDAETAARPAPVRSIPAGEAGRAEEVLLPLEAVHRLFPALSEGPLDPPAGLERLFPPPAEGGPVPSREADFMPGPRGGECGMVGPRGGDPLAAPAAPGTARSGESAPPDHPDLQILAVNRTAGEGAASSPEGGAPPGERGAGAGSPELTGRVLEQLHGSCTYFRERAEFPAEVRVVLNPPELGEVSIRVLSRQGKLTARIVAEAAAVREMLANSLPELHERFAQSNLHLERIDLLAAGEAPLEDHRFRRGDPGGWWSGAGGSGEVIPEGERWSPERAGEPAHNGVIDYWV